MFRSRLLTRVMRVVVVTGFDETDFGVAPDRVDLGELGTVIELHE